MADRNRFRNPAGKVPSSLFPEDDPLDKEERKEKRKLIPGETLIGTRTVIDSRDDNCPRTIEIYYGNYVNPPVRSADGRHYIPMKSRKYLEILNAFLDSEEGQEFERPSEQEINDASAEVFEVVENHFRQEQRREVSGTIQPGRKNVPAEPYEKEETPEEDETVQTEKDSRKFADDMPEEEAAAIRFLRDRNYTRQQMDAIRREFRSEKKRSAFAAAVNTVLAAAALVLMLFLAGDSIAGLSGKIELELTAKQLTVRAGEPFNARDYVKYVTPDEDVYIIYPVLDTSMTGEYDLIYIATNGRRNVRKKLKVRVIDGEAPLIVLNAEEIRLIRDRDEGIFDPNSCIDSISDNIDADVKLTITPIDWSKDEQILVYKVQDSARNIREAAIRVKIEDRAVCDRNATYDPESNTCTCNRGYRGNGSACSLIQSDPAPAAEPSDSSPTSISTDTDSSGPSDPGKGRFIHAASITVRLGTSIGDVSAQLVAGITSSSGYIIDYSAVNTSAPGTYPVYIHGNDGAEGSCTVTVVEEK